MSSTTFNQFQAKIRDAKKRIKEHGEQFIQAVTALSGDAPVALDELVVVDTEELKKLETEMGAKLKAEFTELIGPEEPEEMPLDETAAGVEKLD